MKTESNPTEQHTPGDLLLTGEVAQHLRTHVESVRRFIRERRLRALKVGRGWRITRAELERFKADGGFE